MTSLGEPVAYWDLPVRPHGWVQIAAHVHITEAPEGDDRMAETIREAVQPRRLAQGMAKMAEVAAGVPGSDLGDWLPTLRVEVLTDALVDGRPLFLDGRRMVRFTAWVPRPSADWQPPQPEQG